MNKKYRKIILISISLLLAIIYLIWFWDYNTMHKVDSPAAINYFKGRVGAINFAESNEIITCEYRGGVILFFRTNDFSEGLVYIKDNKIFKAELVKFNNAYVDRILPGAPIKELPYYETKEYCLY
ncbi:MAG: hypothetical protein NTZ49_02480 [Candidatus Parcubacteria bacterium]|nr:hypothetical protein [Candidatus Parcubacteria bacterium]